MPIDPNPEPQTRLRVCLALTLLIRHDVLNRHRHNGLIIHVSYLLLPQG